MPISGATSSVIVNVAVVIAVIYSIVITFIIASITRIFFPLRAQESLEDVGLDVAMHGEEAYSDGEGAILIPVGD